jgi:hypothetical protein
MIMNSAGWLISKFEISSKQIFLVEIEDEAEQKQKLKPRL